MFKIVWNKAEVHQIICSGGGSPYLLDFWVPIQVYIDDLEISGLNKIPGGDISHFWDFFSEILYVFASIDPERLDEKVFHYGSNVKNRVSGGGFEFYVHYDTQTDTVLIQFRNRAGKEFQIREIPLQDFADGILSATAEVLEDISNEVPECVNEDSYLSLREDMEVIRNWYQERYGTTIITRTPMERSLPESREGHIRWIGVEAAADEEMIECVQKILDITYPNDYLACVKKNSLGFPYPYNIIADERIKRGRGQFVRLIGFDPEKRYILTRYYALNCPAPGINAYLPDGVVPFADALDGDLLCFDYRGGFPPKVVYWVTHEPDPEKSVLFLCDSFTELFDMMEKCE